MKKYYDFIPIYEKAKSENCENIIIAGGKGNGKTYSVIHFGITEYWKTGQIIRYCRRRKESLRRSKVCNLCLSHDKYVEAITDGKYNHCYYYNNRFYLAWMNWETGKVKYRDQREFMVLDALSTVETDSGQDNGDCSVIIYDEFLSREQTLPDEFAKLMKYTSNCRRNRTEHFTPLVMIGNTVARDNDCLPEFGVNLWDISENDKNKILIFKNRKNETNAVFEYCGVVEVQKEASTYYSKFDNTAKTQMICDGCFEIGQYKVRRKDRIYNKFDRLYTLLFVYKTVKIVVDVVSLPSFFYPVLYIRDKMPDDEYLYIINPSSENNVYYNDSFNVCTLSALPALQDVVTTCYSIQNVFFESSDCGEKFRSIAMHTAGMENMIPD